MPKPDEKKNIKWWNGRKAELLARKEVQFYLQLEAMTPDERFSFYKRYDELLARAQKSEAKEIFRQASANLKLGLVDRVKEIAEIAKQKLLDGDYEKPFCEFDPKFIKYNSWVQDYLLCLDKIDDLEGTLTEKVERTLL